MRHSQLCIGDKQLFESYLRKSRRSLAAYAFENIIMWSGLYDIFWLELHGSLCVFFQDAVGCFLFLPPLGSAANECSARECFSIMNRLNKSPAVSRIENIHEEDAQTYRRLGYDVIEGNREYICRQSDMAHLAGSAFKKKRASAQSFEKKWPCEYRPYRASDEGQCVRLFQSWMRERKQKNSEPMYQRLLDDNFSAFKTALNGYGRLGFQGRVITLHGHIKAVTIGYALDSIKNATGFTRGFDAVLARGQAAGKWRPEGSSLDKKSFVIAFEVCDLSVRGIAQFIFRAFCQELRYPDINIMDDSGLANLRRVKVSYRPYRMEQSFIARQ